MCITIAFWTTKSNTIENLHSPKLNSYWTLKQMEMANDRHAYLIIAHTNWAQLQVLVSLLDDKRNDIYVHIDKKSNVSDLRLEAQFSKLALVERHDVRWGDVSQIKAELALFSAAVSGGVKWDMPITTCLAESTCPFTARIISTAFLRAIKDKSLSDSDGKTGALKTVSTATTFSCHT